MVFQIRRSDGSIDAYSSGTLVNPDGSSQSLEVEDFSIQTEKSWKSSETGAEYPIQWVIEVPDVNLKLSLTARLEKQEMNLSYAYWEGAVEVAGMFEGVEVFGTGFVEMTGYASSMEGEF